jgi:DNA (cytosine-5)-methyltransferase 1
VAKFDFIDLFAGIGGFHAALSALGGECVFVSEIDKKAAGVYARNWGWDVKKVRSTDPVVHDDIRKYAPDNGVVTVPSHQVLAAGFPCQPFSKSGAQMGVRDRTRGTLFFNILRILEREDRPRVIFLENVRNLAGPRHTETWNVIIDSLRDLGYLVSSTPTVFSPHFLPPHLGGTPQVRDRVFILGVWVGKEIATSAEGKAVPPVVLREAVGGWSPEQWNLDKTRLPWNDDKPLLHPKGLAGLSDYALTPAEARWVACWDDFVKRMLVARKGKALPGFPLWAEAWQPFDTLPKKQPTEIPDWKWAFLKKNAEFFDEHEKPITDWLDAWFPMWCDKTERFAWTSYLPDEGETVDSGFYFPASRRKLEWQAQGTTSLSKCVLHFRPSGIRAKRPTYLPALVAITQTSVIAERKRRITPREAARLQGLPDWFEFESEHEGLVVRQRDADTYKQLGNGVSVGAVYFVLRKFLKDNYDHLTPELKAVADRAPECPQIPQRPERQPMEVVVGEESALAAG